MDARIGQYANEIDAIVPGMPCLDIEEDDLIALFNADLAPETVANAINEGHLARLIKDCK